MYMSKYQVVSKPRYHGVLCIAPGDIYIFIPFYKKIILVGDNMVISYV